MHPWAIRTATLDSAAGLKALEAATLGDSDLDVDELQAVLARPEQRVYLAEMGSESVGFLATFETASPRGRRLELDMLGVAQEWRGRGIAASLVQHALDGGLACGIGSFRALVAEENVASRKVFTRCGLSAQGGPGELLVYPIRGVTPLPYLPAGWRQVSAQDLAAHAAKWPATLLAYRDLPAHELILVADAEGRPAAGAALLTVHTLAYSGLWIEARWARDEAVVSVLARAAVERAKSANLDEVGLFLHDSPDQSELWAWVQGGLERNGKYHVLTR